MKKDIAYFDKLNTNASESKLLKLSLTSEAIITVTFTLLYF